MYTGCVQYFNSNILNITVFFNSFLTLNKELFSNYLTFFEEFDFCNAL